MIIFGELGWPESAAIITAVTTVVASLTTLAAQQLGRRARRHEACGEELRRLAEADHQHDRRYHVFMRKLRRIEKQLDEMKGQPHD